MATSPVATTKSAKRPKLSDELPDAILRMSQREIEAGMICEKITLTVDFEDSNFLKGKEYCRAVRQPNFGDRSFQNGGTGETPLRTTISDDTGNSECSSEIPTTPGIVNAAAKSVDTDDNESSDSDSSSDS